MKTTTIKCDNCGAVIEKATGDTRDVKLKIQNWYASATVTLHGGWHLCYDCWPKILESSQPLEKRS